MRAFGPLFACQFDEFYGKKYKYKLPPRSYNFEIDESDYWYNDFLANDADTIINDLHKTDIINYQKLSLYCYNTLMIEQIYKRYYEKLKSQGKKIPFGLERKHWKTIMRRDDKADIFRKKIFSLKRK